MDIVRLETRQI